MSAKKCHAFHFYFYFMRNRIEIKIQTVIEKGGGERKKERETQPLLEIDEHCTLFNDNQYIDIHYNDIQYNDMHYNDIQYIDTHKNDVIKWHSYTHKNDTVK